MPFFGKRNDILINFRSISIYWSGLRYWSSNVLHINSLCDHFITPCPFESCSFSFLFFLSNFNSYVAKATITKVFWNLTETMCLLKVNTVLKAFLRYHRDVFFLESWKTETGMPEGVGSGDDERGLWGVPVVSVARAVEWAGHALV